MKLLHRLVPATLCVAALVLTGCEPADTTTPTVKPATPDPASVASNTPETPAAPETPAPTSKPAPAPVNPATKPIAPTRTASNDPVTPRSSIGVVVEPAQLDLGKIATNDAGTGIVKLTNLGEMPRTLLDCKTSCGCTTTNCQKGKVLQPGETVDVEVKLNGGQRPIKLAKTVTFLVSDQPPIQLPLKGEAVAYVTVTPERLNPETHPDAIVVLRAIDDQPFTISSMYPPIMTPDEFSSEPAVEHTLTLGWEALKQQGARSTKLLFTLDHPRTKKALGLVDARGLIEPRGADGTPAPPVRTSTIDLDKMLKDGETEDILKLIVDGKIEIGAIDKSNQTPLIKASRWGNVEVVYGLLEAGADVGLGDQIGRTPLMYGCQSKDLDVVLALLDAGADVEATDQLGNTAICWAAGFGTADIVEELLTAGARSDVVPNMTGFTPLIWAAGFGTPDVITLLIDAGSNLEAKDVMQGSTPLMNAVRTGTPENVKVLLEAGASLEATDNEGKTALLVAASNAGPNAEMVQLLIDAGADITAKTKGGETALQLAERRTDLRAEEVLAVFKAATEAAGG